MQSDLYVELSASRKDFEVVSVFAPEARSLDKPVRRTEYFEFSREGAAKVRRGDKTAQALTGAPDGRLALNSCTGG
jgi:hypothetical protein